jgi:hypothetical protein
MTRIDLATVDTTPTGSRIQRHSRSSMTNVRAAAGMQPESSARAVAGEVPSRVLSAHVTAIEV